MNEIVEYFKNIFLYLLFVFIFHLSSFEMSAWFKWSVNRVLYVDVISFVCCCITVQLTQKKIRFSSSDKFRSPLSHNLTQQIQKTITIKVSGLRKTLYSLNGAFYSNMNKPSFLEMFIFLSKKTIHIKLLII